MNKVILMGRLTRDPKITYSQGENQTCVARYTLAVDRRYKKEGEQDADFISCVAFGKIAEFAEKYLKQGTKIAVTGRIQTGSYTNREGQKVYTTDVIVEENEFAESKNASSGSNHTGGSGSNSGNGSNSGHSGGNRGNTQARPAPQQASSDFMAIPDGIEEELPFI